MALLGIFLAFKCLTTASKKPLSPAGFVLMPMYSQSLLPCSIFMYKAPSARKIDDSPFRSIFTRELDGAQQCVFTARPSRLMSAGG
jgi:hypothetical protein